MEERRNLTREGTMGRKAGLESWQMKRRGRSLGRAIAWARCLALGAAHGEKRRPVKLGRET